MYTFLPAANTVQNDKKVKTLRQVIKKNKISCLTHFTRTDNLRTILQYGILPASVLEGNKTFESVQRNPVTLPNEWKGFVSLNISFPDHKLFNDLNNHKPSDWVIIMIDIQVLLNFSCYFFPGRALDFIRNAPLPNFFLGDYQRASDFQALFSDRSDVKRKDLEIPSYYPTDPTSEVLSYFPIAPSFITQVYFHSDYKFNQWVLHNTEFAMSQNRSLWAVGLEYFSPRSDYTYWKTLR